MQFDFVYADLKVRVTFDSEKPSVFSQLNDTEVMILQQQIYQSLTAFCMLRGFYGTGLIDHDKIRGSENAQDDIEQDGG